MDKRPSETLTGIIGSLLAVLIAFGVGLTDVQVGAVLGFVAWIPTIVTSIVSGRKFYKGGGG